MIKCLIWDWNGTLLDDTCAVVQALNSMLLKRNLPEITLERYRETFAFPARDFYVRCGVKLEEEDWDSLASEYHRAYEQRSKALNGEAKRVLEKARHKGYRQCILSAHRQDLLDRALIDYGIRDYFEIVFGADNLDGAGKLERGRDLLIKLQVESSEVVFIGDSIHDAEVAFACGSKAVLVSCGGHCASRLRNVAPTADSLLSALEIIENL